MQECHKKFTRWAGDIRVGKCIDDLGVRLTPEIGFHHEPHDKYEWDMKGGGFPYGHLSSVASASISSPVSFHHLNVDQVMLNLTCEMLRAGAQVVSDWPSSTLHFI